MYLERGTLRDVEAWAQKCVARVAERIFEVNHNTCRLRARSASRRSDRARTAWRR